MPTAIDPELSDIYQEVSKRGLFKSDEEMQQLGHELRARGIVVDPTQGGLVSPAPTVSDFTSHTVHDAGGAAPPALPSTVKQPSPPLNALQQILGLGGTHGTFYNSGKAAIQGLAQVPEQLLGGMGNIVAGTYGAGADSYEQHQQGQDPGTRAISDAVTNNPLTGPQTMIGHGVAAAKAGKLGEFARGVPAGIGKETVENPVGQILNVLSLVGAGEITLSAAGKGLLDHSVAMEAQAAKYAASGDAARSAIYSQAAARARTAAQGLNRTAFAIHRGTTLGPVGDVARSAAADMADRIAPGSDFAKNLRYQADFSRARAAQLRAEKATRQAANWNRVNKENPEGAINIGGMKPEPAPASTPAAQQGLLTAPPPEDLMQGAVPPPPPVSPLVPEPQPPAAWPGPQPTPTTQPMPTESPAPDLAPAPVVPGTEPQPRAEAPTTEAPTVPLWNNGNPQRLQNTSPENFFSDYQRQYGEAYKANRQMAIDAGAPITEQTGRLLFDKTVAQLRPMYDEATGLLGKQSLLDTIQGAIEHGQKTQEPVLYFNAKPNGKVDPATTRALADFLNDRLASRGDAGKSHVSFYTPDGKSVSGVYAGTYPSVFLTLLANAREQADKHQQQTGQQAPGQSAFDLGSVRLQPGMTPQDVMKIAAAQAKTETAKGAANGQQQPARQPAAGAGAEVPEPTGQLPGAVVGGPGSAPANGAGDVGGGSQTSAGAGTGGIAPAAAGSAAEQPAAKAETPQPVGASAETPAQVEPRPLEEYGSFVHNGEKYDSLYFDPRDPSRKVTATRWPNTGGVPVGQVMEWPDAATFEAQTGQKLKMATVAALAPEEKANVEANLKKVLDDPHVGTAAAEALAQVQAAPEKAAEEREAKEKTNERPTANAADTVRANGPAAVEGRTPSDVRTPGTKGQTAGSADPGAGDVQDSGRQPDGAGVRTERGGGSRPADVPVPAERGGDAAAGTGPEREGRPAQPSAAAPGGEPDSRGDDEPEKHYAGHVYANYHATAEDAIGVGGLGQKQRDLIAAVRLLKRIEDENRMATPEEQKVLVKYPGLGWTGNLLNTDWVGTGGILDALAPLVTPKELISLKGATLNSHYTRPDVIQPMWDWIKACGFQGGKVLEPSAGIGLFPAFMPQDIHAASKVRAVELDSITGRILRQLQQDSRVDIGGFERQPIASDYYDLTISNVPFGNYPVTDKEFGRLGLPSAFTARIHNYFFVKGMRVLRPGGVMAYITTHGTLDSGGSAETVRQFLADEAELVGAIRLPNTAFKGNAATEVTTDILFFQKKGNGALPTGETFQKIVNVGTEEAPIMVNEYFARHPEFVLGTHSMTGTMKRGDGTEYTVLPFEGEDLGKSLSETVKKLPLAIFQPYTHVPRAQVKRSKVEGLQEDTRRGRFLAGAVARNDKGEVAIIQPGGAQELVTDTKQAMQLGHYMDVRDSLLAVLEAQQAGADDAALGKAQAALKKAYDAYVKRYGRLNTVRTSKEKKETSNSLWIDDPDAQNVLALEIFKTERVPGASGEKPKRVRTFVGLSDQFTKRTQVPRIRPEKADGAREALLISLREQAKIDLSRMQQLTGMTSDALVANLAGIVFQNPKGGMELASEYGSGNVRQKLAEAEEAAAADPKFKPNVAFLESVQPKALSIGQISVKLGAPWVPKDVYQDFARYITDSVSPKFSSVNTDRQFKWKLEGTRSYTTAATSTYGSETTAEHGGAHALDLMEQAMNGQVPKVYVGTGDDRRFDAEGTALAQAKQDKIKATWKKWVKSDPERASRLENIYNQEVNVIARRVFNGVEVYARRDAEGNIMFRTGDDGKPDPNKPLFDFEGMNPMINLRIHQVNAVLRSLQQANTLWAHEVGTGKTFTGVTLAMEMRRLGIRNKPMILVKPRTLPQIANDFIKLYPGAKILVGDDDAVKGAENRQRFMARIATGDWDAVIVSHNTLNLLPMHPEAVERFYQQEIDAQRAYLDAAKNEKGEGFTVKEIERTIKSMEAKLEKVMENMEKVSKDANLFFEELGVDHFIVDEAQKYKNMTVLSGRGMSKDGAPFATDFFIKMQHVQSNGGGATFMTGTPLTNSISEIHTLMRCLAPETLAENGLMAFDAFAAQYADNITKLERTTDLSYKERTKLGLFSNIPELMNLYTSFTDTMLAKDVPELVRPRLVDEDGNVTDKPIVILSQSNPHQKAFYRDAKRRTRSLKKPPQKGDDTVMSIGTDVRLASLDVRLRWLNAPDYQDSKINQVVRQVHKEYSKPENMKDMRTQLVFLDLGIDLLYPDIKNKLVDLGIPAKEIAFISDAKDEDQLEDLFDDVNDGVVRVLIGSREKMGVGVNVQKRLIAIHQVDPTYRPDQMEQADGRILRHGNMFADAGVRIYQYVHQASGDSFMWNKVAAKATYIAQVTHGNAEMREAEDIEGDDELTQDEIDAIADGNPYLIELQQVKHDVMQLEMVEKSDADAKESLRKQADYLKNAEIPMARTAIARAEKAKEYVQANKPAKFAMTVGDKPFGEDKKSEAAEALWKAALDVPTWGRGRPIGSYRGFTVKAEVDNTQEKPQILFTLTPATGGTESLTFKRYRSHYDAVSPSGLVTVMDNTLDSYPAKIESATKHADQQEQEIPKMLAEAAKPFEDAERLEKLQEKLKLLTIKVQEAGEGVGADDSGLVFTPADRVITKAEIARAKADAPVEAGDPARTWYAYRHGEFVPVNGTRIKMPPELAHYECFVYKLGGTWYAVEATTGASFANAATKAAAIEQGIARISDLGERFDDALTKSVANTGLSPRAQARTPGGESQDSRAVNDASFTVDSKAKAADSGEYPAGSTLNMGIDPGLGKLAREDITPGMKTALGKLLQWRDEIFAVLSPASLDNAAITARSFREHGAAKAQQMEIAHNELKAFGKLLKKLSQAQRYAFYDSIETGGTQPTPQLQEFADMLRGLLDQAKDEVRGLGTGKLDQFLQNYMPHYYKNVKKAQEYYDKKYGQRGLNRSASFLKQRTYDTLKDAMAAGLEPLTDDPIELVLMKLNEMHRYVMAQRVLQDMKPDPNQARYVPDDQRPGPSGWEPLEGTQVWKGSDLQVKEAYDKLVVDALEKLMKDLGVTHDRKQTLAGGQAWGRARGKDNIETKFAGPESTLIHELGHIIDNRYDAWDFLTKPNLRVPGVQGARKKIAQELKDLADLRYEGQPAPGLAYRQYVRQKGEKVANAIMAMIYAPEKMQQAAPTVKLRLERLIRQNKELSPLLDIKPSLVTGERVQALDVGGRILAGQYWAPPEVARIYNNYLSPGLRGKILYDALRFVGNAMNQAQLGLSGFHFMFTMNDALFSQAALGFQRAGVGTETAIRGALRGDTAQMAQGARMLAKSPVDIAKALYAPLSYQALGRKFQREYYHPGTQGLEMARIVDAAIAGGFRAKMDSQYKNDVIQSMQKSFRAAGERYRRGSPLGGTLHAAFGAAKSPFAFLEWTAAPLMEHWVPWMKAGSVTALLQAAIDDLPPGATLSRDQLRKMAAVAVDTVDDRMGQLAYDNLFWNKAFKEGLMVSFRSVGWNIGSLRILAGAAYDVASAPKRLLSGRGGGGGKLPPHGGNGGGGSGNPGGFDPLMTPKIGYMMALFFFAGIMGAIYQFLHTGERPKDARDLYTPRTGKISDNGKPERVQMATYMKDVHGYGTHPVTTLVNKLHPAISTAIDALENRDYFGTEIRNEDDPIVKQLQQSAAYALTQFEPFSFSNAVKSDVPLMSERGAENFFGITPAPKDIDYTAAEKLMVGYLRGGGDTRTLDQAKEGQLRRDLVGRERKGENVRAALIAAVRGSEMTRGQARGAIRSGHLPWQVTDFRQLSAEQALKVFAAATPAEKRMFAPYLKRRVKNQTPAFRAKAIDALRQMVR